METNNTEETTTTEKTTLNDPKAVLAALDRAKSDAKKFREEKEKLEVDLNSTNQKIAEFSGKLLHEKVLQKISDEGVKDPRRLLKFMDLMVLIIIDLRGFTNGSSITICTICFFRI